MSTKNVIHSAEVISRQINRHRPALFVITIILLSALVVILITVQSRNSQAAESISIQPVVYNNALEMKYAQPWLDKAKSAAPAVRYSEALAMQYAQPWLDKQKVEAASVVQYSDALSLQYAQPWLDKQQTQSCNGRLDMMYACRHGYQPYIGY